MAYVHERALVFRPVRDERLDVPPQFLDLRGGNRRRIAVDGQADCDHRGHLRVGGRACDCIGDLLLGDVEPAAAAR
ncbi:hypothetical protein ABN034_14730 [Actinopolymorpha sp. B11F2]|uniref:hypothetical protein n=1 Tax=Actinopolymorpha sp. B11F2 TaxID=3160862 RepID=UPI0032E36FE6